MDKTTFDDRQRVALQAAGFAIVYSNDAAWIAGIMRIDLMPWPQGHGDYEMTIMLPDGRSFTVTIGGDAIERVGSA
jgi:hypothetical protein